MHNCCVCVLSRVNTCLQFTKMLVGDSIRKLFKNCAEEKIRNLYAHSVYCIHQVLVNLMREEWLIILERYKQH